MPEPELWQIVRQWAAVSRPCQSASTRPAAAAASTSTPSCTHNSLAAASNTGRSLASPSSTWRVRACRTSARSRSPAAPSTAASTRRATRSADKSSGRPASSRATAGRLRWSACASVRRAAFGPSEATIGIISSRKEREASARASARLVASMKLCVHETTSSDALRTAWTQPDGLKTTSPARCTPPYSRAPRRDGYRSSRSGANKSGRAGPS
eukprot:scaffold1208_cov113-Isochrysis_galbana.AAC.7